MGEKSVLEAIHCLPKCIYLVMSYTYLAFQVAQRVKSLPAIQETGFRSLGWEDPLEKGMVTHPSILAWKIPWMEEPARL